MAAKRETYGYGKTLIPVVIYDALRDALLAGLSADSLKARLCGHIDVIAGDIEDEARRAWVAKAMEDETN